MYEALVARSGHNDNNTSNKVRCTVPPVELASKLRWMRSMLLEKSHLTLIYMAVVSLLHEKVV